MCLARFGWPAAWGGEKYPKSFCVASRIPKESDCLSNLSVRLLMEFGLSCEIAVQRGSTIRAVLGIVSTPGGLHPRFTDTNLTHWWFKGEVARTR